MKSVTDVLIRRAASQAVSLARQNCRALYTDPPNRAPETNVMTEVPRRVHEETETHKTIHDLPGPGLPVFGTTFEITRNYLQYHELQRKFHAKYGRIFKERVCGQLNASIADPNLVEEVLRHEGKFPNRPPYEGWLLYKKLRKRSSGIVAAQGEEWRKIRSMLNANLMKPKHAHKYFSQLSSISEHLPDKIKGKRDDGDQTVPNILNVLYAWSIDCITQVLIDKPFGCLAHSSMPQQMNEFVKAIEDMMTTSHVLISFASVHKWLNTKIWQKHVSAWDKIIEVAAEIIDDKMAEIGKQHKNNPSEMADGSFLEYLLAKENLTEEEIYMNMTELLITGTDTTANAVAVGLNLLAQNPVVQEKVRKEVDSIDTNGAFTLEDVKSMSYIKAFTKEVLRYYPTIPINARVLTEDTKIAGYVLPKNTILLLNTFTMCRDPKNFTNPDDFIPERWLRNEVRDFSPFTSLPFGYGTRSCVGRRIAENMIYLSVANIIKRYRLVPVEGATAMKPEVRTILTFGENLPVQFIDR